MSDQADSNVVAFPEPGLVDPEKKLVEVFKRVRTDIASIQSIEEILKLRSQAEALRVYAIQIKCSKETLDQIAEIKVRAERRLGQILALRPETRGGDRRSVTFQKSIDSTFDSDNPTLETLGVTKGLSSRSQAIAGISDDQFEKRLKEIKEEGKQPTSSEMLSFAKYLDRKRERAERRERAAEEAAKAEPDERIRIFHGDFRAVLNEETVPTESVSLVLTDPMYGRDHLPLWSDMSTFAARVLKPGHLVVTYSGQTYLPHVLKSLEESLTYVWVAGVRYSYPNNIFPLRIKNSLKLLLLFAKGDYDPGPTQYWLHDLIDGDQYPETKRESELQQGQKESEYLIKTLTHPGDLVVDPFIGTGTVGVACKRLNRRFIGCDIDQNAVNTALARLSHEPEPNEL